MGALTRRRLVQAGLAAPLLGAAPRAIAEPSSWITSVPLPLAVQEIYPAAHDGRVFVAGGIGSRLKVPFFSDRCVSWSPGELAWRDEPDLPDTRHHGQLASLSSAEGDELFLLGGFIGGYTRIWRMVDTVHQLGADGWLTRLKMPRPRAEGVAAVGADGLLHLVSGQSPKGEANSKRSDHVEVTDHWLFDASDQRWRELAPIPTARNSACGGWLGDQLIVTGGRTAAGNLSVTEIYDTREDRWRSAAPLPLPQAGTASAVLGGSLYVFGGEIFQPEAKVFSEVWRYDLSADRWFAEPSMPTPRHGLGGVVLGDSFGERAFLIGGATGPSAKGTSELVEVYRPVGSI